jgi:pSer/pThr/pTyr-binding forkhead associated (FHA) protein
MFEFLFGKKHFTCFLVTLVTPEGTYQKIVDEKNFVIGRSPECHFSVPDPEISRTHLQVSCEREQVKISDLGSSNKTFLNGQPIPPHSPVVVGPSDEIRLGKTSFSLKITVYEKHFKESFVKDAPLSDSERKNVTEVLLGARQEAQRIVHGAQTHQEKIVEAAQAKAEQMLEQFKRDASRQIDDEMADMRKQAQKMVAQETEKLKLQQQQNLQAEAEKKRQEMATQVQAEKTGLQSQFADLKKQVEDFALEKTRLNKEVEQLRNLKKQEMESRQKELQELERNRLADLEKKLAAMEKETKDRIEVDQGRLKMEAAEHDGQLSVVKGEISSLKEQKKSLMSEIEAEKEVLQKLQNEAQHLQTQISETERLKTEAGKLKLQIEEQEHRHQELEQQYRAKVLEYEKKLETEFSHLKAEREKQFAEAVKVDEEKAKKFKSGLIEELQQVQETLIQDLHQRLSKAYAAQEGQHNLATFSSDSGREIRAVFSETLPQLSLETMKTDEMSARISRRYRRQKYKWASVSLTLGVLMTVGIQFGHDRLAHRSLASVMDEQQKQRELELEQRKFRPEQVLEVKATYTDAVIYTKNFTEAYLDDQVQRRWVKEATHYLFEKWRVPEEKAIEVLASARTLVKALDEKKQNIHPDFVEQNIEKMRELENQTLGEMAKTLGTKVKLEAFKKFEQKFFTREIIEKENAKISP